MREYESMPEAKRLLIVSYMFPPAGGIAVQRALSFARYLPQCGLHVEVLTAKNPGVPVMDPSLVEKIPASVRVHRTFTPEIPFAARKIAWKMLSGGGKAQGSEAAGVQSARSGWKQKLTQIARGVFSPDPEIVWVPSARRRAAKLVREGGFDAVLMTAPPFSTFLVGTALKKRFPHIKLVADFRDEWLKFYLNTFDFHSTPSIRRKAAAIEREVVALSDLVLTVTDGVLREMRERYPQEPAGKFVCIPNGYDPASFSGFRPRAHAGDKILVTHAGTVYRSSTPRSFLDALDALPEGIRERFEVRFVGRIADDQQAQFRGRGFDVKFYGFLPQGEALALLEETDYLLLSLEDSNHVTGKVFEYLATGKPILAFTPNEGELSKIIQETGIGWQADPSDGAACRALLERAYAEAERGGAAIRPNVEAIRRYERPAQAAMLARLLSALPGGQDQAC